MAAMRGSGEVPSGSFKSTTRPRRMRHISACSFPVTRERDVIPLENDRML